MKETARQAAGHARRVTVLRGRPAAVSRARRATVLRARRAAVLAVAAGSLVATALTAAGPARADGAGHAGATCDPAIRVLDSLPGDGTSRVDDFGAGALSVGVSQARPVYWTGRHLHRIPLPSGYTQGTVEAVNRSGLMVGSLGNATPGVSVAFSYRAGAPAVHLLPRGSRATGVNDHGHIVGEGRDGDTLVGLEWSGGRLRRQLALAPGFTVTAVTAINNAGLVTGSVYGVEDDLWFDGGVVWPADPTAPPTLLGPYYPGDTYDYWTPTAIDDTGRIVGTDYYSRADLTTPVTWASPDVASTYVGLLGDRTSGTLDDISPTTGVAVGTALDSYVVGPWPPDTAPPVQAEIWPGSGPMRALPRLAPDGASSAYAITDDDRVGGSAADAAGATRAVVWTCALEQSYLPGEDGSGTGEDGSGTA